MAQYPVQRFGGDWYVGAPDLFLVDSRSRLAEFLDADDRGGSKNDLAFKSDQDRADFEAMLDAR